MFLQGFPQDFDTAVEAEYATYNEPQVAGIGSFFKKLGSLALGAAGIIAAPFTAGTSLALIGAAGAIGGGLLNSIGNGGGGNGQFPVSGIPEAITRYKAELVDLENQYAAGDGSNLGTLNDKVNADAGTLHNAINQLWSIKHDPEQSQADADHKAVSDAVNSYTAATVAIDAQRKAGTLPNQVNAQNAQIAAQVANGGGGLLGGLSSTIGVSNNTLLLVGAGLIGFYLYKK